MLQAKKQGALLDANNLKSNLGNFAKFTKEALFGKKGKSLEVKQRKAGYVFVIPFIIGALLFVIYPLISSIIYSLSDVKLSEEFGVGLVSSNFGFQHYNRLFLVDVDFRVMLIDSLKNMAINVPIVVIFAFFMASVLNTKFIGRGFARSVMFLPVIIASGVVVFLSKGDLVTQLQQAGDRFASTSGETFQITSAFENMLMGMELNQRLVDFLISSVGRISEITTMSSVSIVIFLAGLQSISPSIYEASYIEGATKWEVFWKISLPMVSPLILLSIVYTVVDSFTSQTNRVMTKIHSEVVSTNFDIASAAAVSYALIIIAILAVVYAILSRLVFYQD